MLHLAEHQHMQKTDCSTSLFAKRRAAISHEIIQGSLCLFRVDSIPGFQHLAPVSYHLIDSDRVVPAIIGAVVINATDVLFLVGKFPQPGASHHLFPGDGTDPDFSAADITGDLWPVRFPPVYFMIFSRQPPVTIVYAALATLIAIFHYIIAGTLS